MKIFNLSGTVASALALLLVLAGCSDPQKQARETLETKGYDYTLKDLLVAASAGDLESIALFNEAGIEIDGVDPSGNTALIKAASAGHLPAVEAILGLGADPRQVNAVGRDALISAASKGHEDVSRMLLNRGADATVKDSEGWGALSIAAYNGHAGVVSLLAANASPAELDDALLVSSFSGDPKVINTLLGQGANINARSPESKTPLMIAAGVGRIDAVRVLLQNQANPFAVDLSNQTAATLAQSAGFEEVTQLITNPGAWGASEEGLEVASEMAEAQEALGGAGIEETLPAGNGALVAAAPVPSTAGESRAPAARASSEAGGTSGTIAAVPVTPAQGSSRTTGSTSSASGTGPTSSPPVTSAPLIVATPIDADHSAVPSTRPAVEAARQLREESKSKPIVALNGSTIHARTPEQAPVKAMVLAAYHEESLPHPCRPG